MRNTLSEKELEFISRFELRGKTFFSRYEIKGFFNSDNEMNVYLHRLRKKRRIIKLNRSKYMLIPVKAVDRKWSEHPFIIIDEMMDGKDYCIVGKAAAYHWGLIDQIPFVYEVYNTRMHKDIEIFHTRLRFKKRRVMNLPKRVTKRIQGHDFIITTKDEAKRWI